MSDRVIEKSFLYLLAVSLLVHVGAFVLFMYLPAAQPPVPPEPLMVDLQDMTLPPVPVPRELPPVARKAERRQRVARETAPRGEAARERLAPSPAAPSRPTAPARPEAAPAPRNERPAPPDDSGRSSLLARPRPATPSAPATPNLAQLFPSASKMARLEETYRKKYSSEVAEGETRFLNTDDIQFGSFLRRFETSVYGVWRYPEEAARRGIEGVTPVKITFNRQGEIVNVVLLESSGTKVLDDEVMRTLRLVGPIGALPRGYDKDQFNLIAFFQYGLSRGGRALR